MWPSGIGSILRVSSYQHVLSHTWYINPSAGFNRGVILASLSPEKPPSSQDDMMLERNRCKESSSCAHLTVFTLLNNSANSALFHSYQSYQNKTCFPKASIVLLKWIQTIKGIVSICRSKLRIFETQVSICPFF